MTALEQIKQANTNDSRTPSYTVADKVLIRAILELLAMLNTLNKRLDQAQGLQPLEFKTLSDVLADLQAAIAGSSTPNANVLKVG